MIEKLINWLNHAWQVLSYSNILIIWNSFLAFIPLVLSVWLFRLAKYRSLFWWLIFLVFIAFLPNAPYVLTDTIHLINLIRRIDSVWVITLVVIPQYTVFILACFEAYTISLINLGYYLAKNNLKKYIVFTELIVHFLSAIGIYLGRFLRFNSWDFVTKPHTVIKHTLEILTTQKPILVIIVTFIVLTFLYWLTKEVNLGIMYRRYSKVVGNR